MQTNWIQIPYYSLTTSSPTLLGSFPLLQGEDDNHKSICLTGLPVKIKWHRVPPSPLSA